MYWPSVLTGRKMNSDDSIVNLLISSSLAIVNVTLPLQVCMDMRCKDALLDLSSCQNVIETFV